MFDRRRFMVWLENLQGVSRIDKGSTIGSCIEAFYHYLDDSTIIRLSEDGKTITISGTGVASMRLAFELQSSWANSLRLFDIDYSVDLNLKDYQAFDSLQRRLAAIG